MRHFFFWNFHRPSAIASVAHVLSSRGSVIVGNGGGPSQARTGGEILIEVDEA